MFTEFHFYVHLKKKPTTGFPQVDSKWIALKGAFLLFLFSFSFLLLFFLFFVFSFFFVRNIFTVQWENKKKKGRRTSQMSSRLHTNQKEKMGKEKDFFFSKIKTKLKTQNLRNQSRERVVKTRPPSSLMVPQKKPKIKIKK